MQSRTDQVHSYEFFLQRVVSGLVARESDPAELPFRRLGWAGFGSVMVAIVVAAVFGIIGVIRGGGNTSWQEENRIIVEKGSGDIYLYIDSKLHPMANLVSAQLATGGGDKASVSARSLEGVPRGDTLGIQGVPHSFPGNGDLLTGAWTFCSQEPPEDSDDIGTISVLAVGRSPTGGESIGTDRAVLVRDTSDEPTFYLVWRGYRFELPEPDVTVNALGANVRRALPVSSSWLAALPLGDPVAPPSAGELGQPSTALDGFLTGDVVESRDRYYLVRSDELVELTPVQAEILRWAGRRVDAGTPRPDTTTPLPPRTETSPPEDPPDFMSVDELGTSVCAVFASSTFEPDVWAGGSLNLGDANRTPARDPERQSALADYVLVPGGKAALVQSLSAPDAGGGSWHIVNEQGRRFPLPVPDVAGAFGYQADQTDQVVRMFGGLVDLLPSGPPLDPAVAREPATGAVAG